jgi:hypothetical protein
VEFLCGKVLSYIECQQQSIACRTKGVDYARILKIVKYKNQSAEFYTYVGEGRAAPNARRAIDIGAVMSRHRF